MKPDTLYATLLRYSDHRRVRLALMIVMLSMFVLGAGAPESTGGPGG